MRQKNKKSCTIRDLASHLSLSTCTVSKVLNNPGGDISISKKTRERVKNAAKELNYVPNVNAQRFFTRRSNVIGLLVPPQEEMGNSVFGDTHFVEILSGIEKALSKTQYNLLLLFNRPEYKANKRYDAMFSSGLLDGLLIWGAHRSDKYWKELVKLTGPRIFLTSAPDFTEDEPLHFIASDYEQAAEGIIKRLMELNCKKFCWLAGKEDTSIIPQIANGINNAGIHLSSNAIRYSDYTEEAGETLAKELLEFSEYDAIVATAPQLARGAMKYIKENDLSVQVGCFDGQSSTRLEEDDYLSAQTNDFEIGEKSIEKILSLIENNEEIVRIKTPVSFTC